MDFLKGKKTYIVAGLMVLSSLVQMVAGDINLQVFVTSPDFNTLLEGIGLGTLRAGVQKGAA